jgi:hypothetical protein
MRGLTSAMPVRATGFRFLRNDKDMRGGGGLAHQRPVLSGQQSRSIFGVRM